jgi:hypothetical protein
LITTLVVPAVGIFVDADHLVMELVSGEGCSFAGRDNDLLDLVRSWRPSCC